MIQIEILKNGKSVRTFYCTEKDFQVKNHYAHSIAGGMWNGNDIIEVISKPFTTN